MGNYEELKAAVASVIKANGDQEITGQVLQNTLTTLISQIGVNATFAGIATPSTAPGTPDQNVFYIAGQSGTYANFNAIVLDNEIAILSNKSGTWVKTTTGFATNDGVGNAIGLDNVNDRPVYVNAIKFIGFVPNEASKDHVFSIHGLSSRGFTKSATPNITGLDLFILDETTSQAASAERRAASLALPANTDITKPTFSKITGNSGTLYVIIDWNPVVNYQVNGKYSYIAWGANFANPSASNLVRIQKLDANDPRIAGFNQIPPISPIQFADFTKLNLGVDGDSITAGNQWSYYATQYLGFANHHNVAVGSATFSDRTQMYDGATYVTQNYDDPYFVGISGGWQPTADPVEIQKRCNNCARVHVQKFISEVTAGTYPVPDIFVFAMGTNDSTIGTVADALNGKDPDALSTAVRQTMVGGARWAIQKIITTYPNCRVYISAPIQRADAVANAKGLEKSIALKEISNSLSVGYFNTFGECGITEKVESGTGPYLSDGLHLNTAGQQLMGKYLAKEIRNNYF